jgi:ankyrin repeat protein
LVALWVKHGHESDSKDSYGRTPLSWAAVKGHEAVVKLLLDKGCKSHAYYDK